MARKESLIEYATKRGVSRRAFLKFCAATSAALALPSGSSKLMAAALASSPRPSVIWLSFQECTGCTESLTRSYQPTVESLILDHLSLDYHHTLQAAAGAAAEQARYDAMSQSYGNYVLVVDGAIPTADGGAWSTIAGVTNLHMLAETAEGAALIIGVGTCAAFGGLPAARAVFRANPNQSGASGVDELMSRKLIAERPLVNIPGCPPIPEAITGVIAHYLAFGTLPDLDARKRPLAYFGTTIHDACPRRTSFQKKYFAKAFDDEAARNGACLFELGCRGPSTHSACPKQRWNGDTSFPVHSGHGCLGCSEPSFWDQGLAVGGGKFVSSSFYPDFPPSSP